MPSTAAHVLADEVTGSLTRVSPKVQLPFVAGILNYVLNWLKRGEIGVALLWDTHLPEGLRIRPLLAILRPLATATPYTIRVKQWF